MMGGGGGGGGDTTGIPDAVNKEGKHLGPNRGFPFIVSSLGGYVKPASKEPDGFEQTCC